MVNRTARALLRATERMAAARAERDRLIVQMSAEGASSRQIAECAGMTHAGVALVLQRMAPQRPEKPRQVS